MTARTSLYTVDPLSQEDAALLRGVADLLVIAFPAIYAGDVTQALADVVQFAPEDRSLIARDSEGAPIGWLAGWRSRILAYAAGWNGKRLGFTKMAGGMNNG